MPSRSQTVFVFCSSILSIWLFVPRLVASQLKHALAFPLHPSTSEQVRKLSCHICLPLSKRKCPPSQPCRTPQETSQRSSRRPALDQIWGRLGKWAAGFFDLKVGGGQGERGLAMAARRPTSVVSVVSSSITNLCFFPLYSHSCVMTYTLNGINISALQKERISLRKKSHNCKVLVLDGKGHGSLADFILLLFRLSVN